MSTLQVAAVEALTAVLDLRVLTGPDVVDSLLPSVLANINAVGSTDEVCLWLLPNPPHQSLCYITYYIGQPSLYVSANCKRWNRNCVKELLTSGLCTISAAA